MRYYVQYLGRSCKIPWPVARRRCCNTTKASHDRLVVIAILMTKQRLGVVGRVKCGPELRDCVWGMSR